MPRNPTYTSTPLTFNGKKYRFRGWYPTRIKAQQAGKRYVKFEKDTSVKGEYRTYNYRVIRDSGGKYLSERFALYCYEKKVR